MTSQLPRFRCLFLSCQQQKNTENGAAVTSLRSFLFRDDFIGFLVSLCLIDYMTGQQNSDPLSISQPIAELFCDLLKYLRSYNSATERNKKS